MSSDEFLPFLRYRTVSEWTPAPDIYTPEVVAGYDSTYRLVMKYSIVCERMLISWFGDSIRVTMISNRSFKIDPSTLSGFDSSIIHIEDNQIIPIKAGKTNIFVKVWTKLDTLRIGVKKQDSVLVVY